MAKYCPKKDIPDLSGKVILVTGGTSGLGTQTVLLLAAHSPSHIIFTGRSTTRANSLLANLKALYPTVKATFISADFGSFASITTASKEILVLIPRLDLLINNAGIMDTPYGVTTDGYEIKFGTNHMSHALLTKLLLPLLTKTANIPGTDVRVIFLSSAAAYMHPLFDPIQFEFLKTPQNNFWFSGDRYLYGQAKLANELYPIALANHNPDSKILFASVHPGVFNTNMVQSLSLDKKLFLYAVNFGMLKDEKKDGQGAWNTCWAATSERKGVENGGFYFPVGEKAWKLRAVGDEALAERLYAWTQNELESWN